MERPLVLTMGEPSGIAPEITIKAWRDRDTFGLRPFFVIADPSLYKDAPVVEIKTPDQAAGVFGQGLPVLPLRLKTKPIAGSLDPVNAPVVLESIRTAVKFCQDGTAGAVITNPIHKSNLQKSGLFDFPGHTEYLAHLTGGTKTPVMMLAAKDLRVVPLTVHMPLKNVPQTITQDLICNTVRIIHAAMAGDCASGGPRIAIAGLNPHAGEEGAFGREEIDVIAPAIARLQSEGRHVSGPHAADTLFHPDARKTYDVAVCMYHDQALIPLKTLDFYGGVNVTLGLDIIRTSPDHGTALAIARQGIANHQSLVQALLLSGTMAHKRAAF